MEEITPEMNYRFTVIEAIDFLNQIKGELFIKLVNIAMADEYSDFDGDEMPADITYFQDCDDQNVQALIKQVKCIQDTIEYLMNVNKVQESELGIKVV